MAIETILSRLSGVKKTGRPGAWVAKCPAHEDRSPSLSVCECNDGRVLLHCFAGCGTDSVLGVLGLKMADLMPESLVDRGSERQALKPMKGFSATEALRTLAHESMVVTLMAHDVANGAKATSEDRARLAQCVGRISEVLRYVDGA